ncbi:hypothetical protein S101447_01814 [Acetobacter ascendens]|uniref:Uncharacterized protein n=1 Tax=Acetobacter ascendens TaxID=481146 RepID=A0A1Y0V470_9PROT|nr:hypothetical protein S101447_01814 [Acetobacter ascendens]
MEHSFLDGFDNAPDLFLDFHLFHLPDIGIGPTLAIQTVGLFRIGAHRLGRDLRCHHPVLEAGEHPAFQIRAGDRPAVGAGTIGDVGRAGEAVGTAQCVRASTLAAEQQTRQQGFRPACAVEPVALVVGANSLGDVDVFLGNDALSRLGRLPECVIDDPQFGHVCDHPI